MPYDIYIHVFVKKNWRKKNSQQLNNFEAKGSRSEGWYIELSKRRERERKEKCPRVSSERTSPLKNSIIRWSPAESRIFLFSWLIDVEKSESLAPVLHNGGMKIDSRSDRVTSAIKSMRLAAPYRDLHMDLISLWYFPRGQLYGWNRAEFTFHSPRRFE